MSKKQKTTQQQTQNYANTNTYGWQTPPETADVQALRDFKFTADPRIGFAFGNAKNQIGNSFSNPLGGLYSPQMRDSIMRSSLSDLAQKEAAAYSDAEHALQGSRYGQQSLLTGLTSPRMVQTGSTGSGNSQGTSTTSSPIWTDLLVGAASGAGAAA